VTRVSEAPSHRTLLGCSGSAAYYEGYLHLPPRIRDWAGLAQCEQESLAAMNDDGLSFDEIANEIEAKL